MPTHHLFLSYSRADNEKPVNAEGEGWVTAFERELKRRHQTWSGRELIIFFDTEAIAEGVDWRRQLGAGIRQSRLFLAFLSPNYITSENCLWEWDEYLRREHSAARGDDGLTPIYFVTPADLSLADDQTLVAWLAEMEKKYPWFQANSKQLTLAAEKLARPFLADVVQRRNKTLNCELQPWFADGPEILKELDAAARSAELKNQPRDPAADPRTLAERLAGLDAHIAERLDRIALAGLAPGNVTGSHEHFVGRHRELSRLHDIMQGGGPQVGGSGMAGRGMIAAAHSPGGLGKTALARQYAHAYAEHYAAGGTWEMACEGATELGAVLLRLAESQNFKDLCLLEKQTAEGPEPKYITEPLNLSEAQKQNYGLAAEAILAYLKRASEARVSVVRAALQRHPEVHSPIAALPRIAPRALLILDNVDRPALLNANQIAQVTIHEWLELIVTTRLDPTRFGGGDRVFEHVEVDVLPDNDALHLLADFQPGHHFASDAEEAAALGIVSALGGYTLAIEIVAAFMGDLAKNHEPAPTQKFLETLQAKNLAWVDSLANKPAFDQAQRHSAHRDEVERKRQNRVGTLVQWSVERLSVPARTALEFASFLLADHIPLDWLKILSGTRKTSEESFLPRQLAWWRGLLRQNLHNGDASLDDEPPEWPAVWRELHGLRLLHPAIEIEGDSQDHSQLPRFVRIHRLVAKHVNENLRAKTTTKVMASVFGSLVHHMSMVARDFEKNWCLDHSKHWVLHSLAENALHLLKDSPEHLELALVLGVSGGAEMELGQLSLAGTLLETSEKVYRHYKASRRTVPENMRLHCESLRKLCALAQKRGDISKAMNYAIDSYVEGVALAQANPQEASILRTLVLSCIDRAEICRQRCNFGDLELALHFFDEANQIAQTLHDRNPESIEHRMDLAMTLTRMGAFLNDSGSREEATEWLERSCLILRQSRLQNPQRFDVGHELTTILKALGEVLEASGRYDRAAKTFEEACDLAHSLRENHSDLDIATRLESNVLTSMGEFHSRRGDLENAFRCYENAVTLRQAYFESNPMDSRAGYGISVILERMADLHELRHAAKDLDAALCHYKACLEIRRNLKTRNPDHALYSTTLAIAHNKIAICGANRDDKELQNRHCAEAYRILNELLSKGVTMDEGIRFLYSDLASRLKN